jgi:hypothetical protein
MVLDSWRVRGATRRWWQVRPVVTVVPYGDPASRTAVADYFAEREKETGR